MKSELCKRSIAPDNWDKWNKGQTAVAATVGGITGGYGSTMAKGANVGKIGLSDLVIKSPRLGTYIKNNSTAVVILLNEQVIGATAKKVGQSINEDKKESKGK